MSTFWCLPAAEMQCCGMKSLRVPSQRQILRAAQPTARTCAARHPPQAAPRRRVPRAFSCPRSHAQPHEHSPQQPPPQSEAPEPVHVLLAGAAAAGRPPQQQCEAGAEQHHGHQHGPDLDATALHRALTWLYRRTGLLQLAALLRENVCGSIAISVLILVAALAQWQAAAHWLPHGVGATISTAATAAIYVLAGIPAAVDLTYDLASLHVDTHVLMTLAVMGTLAIGGALEVNHCALPCMYRGSHVIDEPHLCSLGTKPARSEPIAEGGVML